MRSEAQKRADKKYSESGKNNYTTLTCRLHKDRKEDLEQAAKNLNLTVSKFLLLSALYCAEKPYQLKGGE